MPNLIQDLLSKIGQAGLEAQGMASGGSDNAFSLSDLLESQLGGYYKGADKAMKTMGEQQVTEALQQGVPATEIIKSLVKMVSPKSAFDPGGIEQGQQGEVTGIRQPGWVSRIGQAGLQAQGIQPTGTPEDLLKQLLGVAQIQGQQTQTQLAQQKLVGEEPLQVGEREKLQIEFQTEITKKLIELDKEGRLKPNDLFQGFEQASKIFIGVRDSHARVEAATQDPSAAGDLALIFNFMKVLDPGSVVREGEFATAQNAAGVPVKVMNIYNKVLSGKRLAPQQRADFLDRSRRLFKSAQDQQQKTTSEFSRLAIKNQLNPEILFRDVGLVLQRQQGISTGEGTTKSGNKYRRIQ